ncbi:MAG TPA: penicillin-binding protein activator [Rhizomicrobium sp.]|nr:penicillin-binding protein activator [Rhizomicrobium sp.]
MTAPKQHFAARLCFIAALVAIGALASCQSAPPAAPPPVAPVSKPGVPPPSNPMTAEEPTFLKMGNIPSGTAPVRVGVLLPFTNGSAQTRALAASMMKAAQLALFDSGNNKIILMSADEGSTPESAAAGARTLIAEGAEVIVGPLFSTSVAAVAPIAHDRAVPVISFSTDRGVAGNGVYLLSFQPENEIRRIISYAHAQGHNNFAALVPPTAYGAHITDAMKDTLSTSGGTLGDVEKVSGDDNDAALKAVAATKPDAVMIAAGGEQLRTLAPMLAANGVNREKVQLLGSGVWDDPANCKESMLEGGIFAAPAPDANATFNAKYKATYGTTPPQLSALAYDAMSLVALLAPGQPYHRFTDTALTDPNGFAGVDGIFRFNPDGSSERGLAILSVHPDGFRVVDPAPKSFEQPAQKSANKQS